MFMIRNWKQFPVPVEMNDGKRARPPGGVYPRQSNNQHCHVSVDAVGIRISRSW